MGQEQGLCLWGEKLHRSLTVIGWGPQGVGLGEVKTQLILTVDGRVKGGGEGRW